MLVTVLLGTVTCGGDDGNTGPTTPVAPTTTGAATRANPPANLVNPVDPLVISLIGVINPFGIVRFSLDLPSLGHSGIDLPAPTGASIRAVADGRIVKVTPETDGLPGDDVWVLLAEGAASGTGWIFRYEHVTLAAGLGVGAEVRQGEVFASNAQNPRFTNHYELAWAFNDFEFTSHQTCWVTQLGGAARARLETHFDNVLRADPRFISAWTTVTNEGHLPFRALLDPARFPDGPQLCYSPGTDVRESP